MHSVNLSKWVTRLGFKRNDQPEFIYGVQPTTLLRDESALLPPVLPAEAIAGDFLLPAAGKFGAGRFRNSGNGHALVWFRINSGAILNVSLGTTAGAGAITALTKEELNPSLPTTGVAELVALDSAVGGAEIAGIATGYEIEFWCPPGMMLTIAQASAAAAANWTLRWLEYPPERSI